MNTLKTILVVALALCCVWAAAASASSAEEQEAAKRGEKWEASPCSDIRIKDGKSHTEADKECEECCAKWGGAHWFLNMLNLYQYCLCAGFQAYGRR